MKKGVYMKWILTFILSLFLIVPASASDNWQDNWGNVVNISGTDRYICINYLDNNDYQSAVADSSGNIIYGPVYGLLWGTDDPDRYIYGRDFESMGLIDNNGNTLVDFAYSHFEKIKGYNAYIVSDTIGSKYGVIDDSGKILINPEYDYISPEFKYELLLLYVYDDDYNINLGFADVNFNIVLPTIYSTYIDFNNSLYVGIKDDNSQTEYYKINSDNKTEYINIVDGEAVRVIDNNTIQYTKKINSITNFGTLDSNFNTVINACWQSTCGLDFKDNYAIVQSGSTSSQYIKGIGDVYNGKYGVINKNGEILIQPVYDSIIYSGNDTFICISNGSKKAINVRGTLLDIEADPWAVESIKIAIAEGLVPETLQCRYREKITRKEFSRLALQTFTVLKHSSLDNISDLSDTDVFTDTDDKYVIAAYKLGIVNGRGNGKFSPNEYITRQEAAVMLCNLLTALNYTPNKITRTDFVDKGYFADWAKDSIYKISSIKDENGIPVMAGTGGGKFSPWYNYDIQQAIATLERIYTLCKQY